MKPQLIKSGVEINFGTNKILVDLYVSKNGNLEVVMSDKDRETLAPNGTCTEGREDEVIIYPFKN